jgi:outer membrane protein assembly factor BamD (BamD/ComL family)
MRDAIEKKGQVERALKNKDEELKGYATVAARHHGTNAGMTAQLATARALCYYERSSEGIALLRGIASDYPKSVWAVRALFTLAEQQGDSPDAVETLRKIAGAYPQSIFRVEAQMKLAAVYLTLAGMEKDQDKKDAMRAQAREACDTVLRDYPLCPETDEAKDFIQRNKL